MRQGNPGDEASGATDVLVVDDNPTNIEVLSGVLAERGFAVRVAPSGQRALAAAQARVPDIVMLDIQMPQMDGYEVCRRLKADPLTRDVPVIFLSALDEAVDKVRAFEVGGADYVTKPFQFGEVLARIESQLKMARLQEETARRNDDLSRSNAELKAARKQSDALAAQLTALNRVTHSLGLEKDAARMLARAADETSSLFAARTVLVCLVDGEGVAETMRVVADCRNDGGPLSLGQVLPLPAGWRGDLVLGPAMVPSDMLGALRGLMRARGCVATIAAPILTRGEAGGILALGIDDIESGPGPAEMDMLYTLAAQLAAALEDIRLFEHLEVARAAAEGANHTKSAFLASMSHELRTPLNAIIGYGELLAEEAEEAGHEEYLPDLTKIQKAARHLLALINDILDLSKIEAGKLELSPETFDVSDLVQEVASMVSPLVERNGNTLELSGLETAGKLHADPLRVRQVLFNLISNAAKFTQKGRIRLAVERNADGIAFAVEDAGIGMTPEQLGRLFQPFSQAEASTAKKYGGTGLGLVICRRLCRLMGGEIDVTSELGRGTVFRVRLPNSSN
jgi:signal transduction histidine kinase/DNA-binding response OmpR family regulator